MNEGEKVKTPINFNEIPSELRLLPQWILWRAEEKVAVIQKYRIK